MITFPSNSKTIYPVLDILIELHNDFIETRGIVLDILRSLKSKYQIEDSILSPETLTDNMPNTQEITNAGKSETTKTKTPKERRLESFKGKGKAYQKKWRIIGALIIAILGVISSVTGILSFIGISWNPFNIHQALVIPSAVPTPTNPSTDIELVLTNGQRVLVKSNNQVITNGGIIKLGRLFTVSFTIINNGSNVADIQSLVIGARGPGVSCEDKNSQKWAAPQMSFQASPGINLNRIKNTIIKRVGPFIFQVTIFLSQ